LGLLTSSFENGLWKGKKKIPLREEISKMGKKDIKFWGSCKGKVYKKEEVGQTSADRTQKEIKG